MSSFSSAVSGSSNSSGSASNETLLAALLDGMADMAYLKDLEGRYLFINPAGVRLLGKPAGEIVGRDELNLFSPEIARIHMDQDRATLASGGSLTFEEEIRLNDRTIRLQTRKSICRDAQGTVIGLTGIAREMSERKPLEAAQRQREMALNENRYRSLVHATAQIVWSVDAEGGQMGRMPGWLAFTGQSEAEVEGVGFANAIHPDDREKTLAAWQASIRSGESHTMEHRLRRADGVYRDMAVRAVPVRDDAGQIVEWVGTHTDVTEQRAIERENRETHRRLQNVLDSFTDGLCVLDRDLTYLYFNESGARMVGLRPEDIVGTRVGDTFKENRTNLIQRSYRQAIATGQPTHVEEYSLAPLNKWFESNCYPSAEGLTVYFRDITERKRTEEALRKSESRFRNLSDSGVMGIAFPDRYGGFREGNEEFLRITGYSRSDLEAGLVRWDTMTPPEFREIDAVHIAEAARNGSCTPYEKEYIRKDGSRVPILCGYALLEGSKDEYIGFIIDITRLREAEAELRERELRFRLLAESLPELIWISDSAGSLLYLNSRFLEYCGIPADSMVGFDWQNILHPEEIQHVNQAWSHAVATGQPYRIELRMRAHDGSFRYFIARALPMRNAAGEVEQWVGSCADIHDRRLAEEALRRSEKLAATGRLAASIAHEINNPLTSVTNTLYLALQDPDLHPQTRELLKTADEELARVSQITTQTLRFHRQSKAACLADLSEIMQSVLALFSRRLAGRQIAIVAECAPNARIRCLEDELRQVFTNLVSNSNDAMTEGGKLRIRIRQTAWGDVPGVRVTVADTGSGIPREIRHRIFEPFFSTKDSTGIGLGLWVSEGILRKHAARIRIRSASGPSRHGTVFSLVFPENGIR